jgi:hypothetical protein
MLVEDLLGKHSSLAMRDIHTLRTECSQFIRESAGLPLYRALPSTNNDFHRVKVRAQKRTDNVSEAFNTAFKSQFYNLRQRAIFAYSSPQLVTESTDQFYVFPIDGYKFLYSKEVTNSNADYKQVVDTLFEKVDDISNATEIITDLLKFTYTNQNLYEGIMAESEIILYGIPYYYAVRMSASSGYSKLVSQ